MESVIVRGWVDISFRDNQDFTDNSDGSFVSYKLISFLMVVVWGFSAISLLHSWICSTSTRHDKTIGSSSFKYYHRKNRKEENEESIVLKSRPVASYFYIRYDICATEIWYNWTLQVEAGPIFCSSTDEKNLIVRISDVLFKFNI